MRGANRLRALRVRWRGRACMLFLVVVLMIAAGLFYWAAANVHQGMPWADRVCSDMPLFCAKPWWLLAATGVVIVLAIARRMLTARRA
jgi:hypothetical protein